MWPIIVLKITLGVFVVWKKVLVKRRAVNRSVCLLTIDRAIRVMIQVNAGSISLLYL